MSIEDRIQQLLEKYLGHNWKMFVGLTLFIVASVLEQFSWAPEDVIFILKDIALVLAGIGAWGKVKRMERNISDVKHKVEIINGR